MNQNQNRKSGLKPFLQSLNPGNFNLKNKIQFLVITSFSIVLLLIISTGIIVYNNSIFKSAEENLQNLLGERKYAIESYFKSIINQITVISSSESTINALKEFNLAFDAIGNYGLSENKKIINKLNEVYANDLIENIYKNTGQQLDPKNLIPKESQALYLQYFYIAENNNPTKQRYLMNSSADNSDYGFVHNAYHPIFKEIMLKFSLEDIYLVSNKGDIIYSANKKYDLGTNLNTGTYSQSGLSSVFKASAAAINNNYVKIGDYSFYYPEGYEPALFCSSPIFHYSENIGVLIFEFSEKHIGNIVNKLKRVNANNSDITFNLYGIDQLFRSNTYDSTLPLKIDNEKLASRIRNQEHNILIQKVPEFFVRSLENGVSGLIKMNRKIYSYTPIEPFELNWGLLASLDINHILVKTRKLTIAFILLAILILVVLALISNKIGVVYANNINKIKKVAEAISQGEDTELIESSKSDELGQMTKTINQLGKRIKAASDFALQLGKGAFDVDFKPLSDNDTFGISLSAMKESLINAKEEEEKRKEEDEIRNYINHGIAQFNDLLRQDNDDLTKLSYNLVKELLGYTGIEMGALYLLEVDENDEQKLKLIAAHAYDRRKYLTKEFNTNEGLIGTCFLEQKTVYLKEIPEDYIDIVSGLGQAKPKMILLVPLKMEENVLGILELAGLKELKQYEIEFIEKIANNTASTLITVRLNLKTQFLLEEAKKRESELIQQEEEMRQNLEEMKATQEELSRLKEVEQKAEEERKAAEKELLDKLKKQNDQLTEKQSELEKEEALFNSLLNNANEYIYFKDLESRFLRVSQSMIKTLKQKRFKDIIGKTDFDFFDEEHARPAFDDEQNIIKKDKPIIDLLEKEVRKDGSVSWVNTSKMPLKNREGKIIGTWGISKDVTEQKQKEQDLIDKQDTIQKLKTDYDKFLTNYHKELDKEIKKLRHMYDENTKEILFVKSELDKLGDKQKKNLQASLTHLEHRNNDLKNLIRSLEKNKQLLSRQIEKKA